MFKKNAFISVYNKVGIIEFVRALVELDWKIFSTGGTARHLMEAGIPVTDIAEIVGGGSILGGRVKSIARELHAGMVARDIPEDHAELSRIGAPWIDLVCVDSYPLGQEVLNPDCTPESVIEMTDLGGPDALRSAAKGLRIVICFAADRLRVIEWLRKESPNRLAFVTDLAAKAWGYVASYDLISARYHSGGQIDGMIGMQVQSLRYGENGHQPKAALFSFHTDDPLAFHRHKQIAGADPSLVNCTDLNRMAEVLRTGAAAFDLNFGVVPAMAAVAKHSNPPSAGASRISTLRALKKMLDGNPLANFGGVMAANRTIGKREAECIVHYGMDGDKRRYLNGILAPRFTEAAVEILGWSQSCRLFVMPALAYIGRDSLNLEQRFVQVTGGMLLQSAPVYIFRFDHPELEIYGELTDQQRRDLVWAWVICARSDSNTIDVVRDGQLLGLGTGQTARVYASRFAIELAHGAGHDTEGAVAFSDSFFSHLDAVEVLVEAGVRVIGATNGVGPEDEIKAYCAEHGVTLVWIPDKVGRAFYGHC